MKMKMKCKICLVLVGFLFGVYANASDEMPLMQIGVKTDNTVKSVSIENGETILSVILSDNDDDTEELVLTLKEGQEFNPALSWELSMDSDEEGLICPVGAYKLSSCLSYELL